MHGRTTHSLSCMFDDSTMHFVVVLLSNSKSNSSTTKKKAAQINLQPLLVTYPACNVI